MQADSDDRIESAPPRRARPLLFVVLTLAVLGGLGWAVRSLLLATDTSLPPVPVQIPGTRAEAERPPTVTTPTESPPAAGAQTAAVPTTPPPVAIELPEPPLPELATSDEEVRASLQDVLPAALQPALGADEILRRVAVMATGFARGKVLRDKLALPGAKGSFVIEQRGERIYLASANFSRYDGLVDTVAALDAEALARWFRRYEPLLQQAWAELGDGEGGVRAAMLQGLELLIAAPDLQGDIELVQPSVFYRYADPAIEALPDSQKLMIRMGPGNREVVRRKAERLRDALAR